MPSTQQRIRALRARITEGGGEVLDVSYGRHVKIRFRNPQGVEARLVIAMTPSDWRADKSANTVLRRLMAASTPPCVAMRDAARRG